MTAPRLSYTMTDADTFATIRDDAGRVVGTLTRPAAVFKSQRPCWTVANRDGETVLRSSLRPTRIAIARALL